MEKQEKKPLSSAQVKYMQNRLHVIKVVKMRDIEREYDGLDDLGDILTEEIRAGRVKLVPGKLVRASYRTDLADVLYFEKYRGTAQVVNRVITKQTSEAEVRKDRVRDEMAKILDQVMLGDADRALKMLEDFTAKSF
jgi:hypothetical protein